jgi:hypothetical protein
MTPFIATGAGLVELAEASATMNVFGKATELYRIFTEY